MTEVIEEEYLPQCLAMGISRTEFGELNITKLRPYILAENIKFEKMNQQAHLQGRYIFDAVSIAISNALRSKGQKAINYMDTPYDFDKLRREQKEEEARRVREEKMKAEFMMFSEGLRKKLEVQNGNNDR